MPMSVRELVSEPRLRLELLVPGDQDGLIRWVHSSEMPQPGRYLMGGEVVLTAGVWYMGGTDPAAWVASLVDARAAAVGFGVTPILPEVPSALIDACRGRGLTLFRAPLDMAFVTVSEVFIARYVADHERPLRDAVRRNQQLISAIADGAGMPGILEVMCRYRPGNAFVASHARGLLAWAGERPSDQQVAKALAAASAGSRHARSAGIEARPIVGAGGGDAALFLEHADAPQPVEARMAIDQAIPYLGLELQRAVAARETERRIAAELFDLVLAGPALLPATASRLRTLQLDSGALLGFVAESDDPDGALDRLEAAIAGQGLRGVVAVKGTQLWGVVRWEAAPSDVGTLASRLSGVLGPGGAIGVGRPADGAEHLHESLVEARHACRFARQRRPERIATYAEVGTHQLLLALQDEGALVAFRDAVLGPIVAYDQRRGTELLRTLELFLASGGEYGSTAEELHIHVNTLRLRLARIESLTSRSLARTDDWIDLYLALRLGR